MVERHDCSDLLLLLPGEGQCSKERRARKADWASGREAMLLANVERAHSDRMHSRFSYVIASTVRVPELGTELKVVNLKKMMLACFASKVDTYLVDSKSVIEGCEEGVKLVWKVSVSVWPENSRHTVVLAFIHTESPVLCPGSGARLTIPECPSYKGFSSIERLQR